MDIKYTTDHEWIRLEGEIATVGITSFAQEQLGDLVFIQLPEKGQSLAKGDVAATVESVKAVSEVYSPLTGEVLETNAALADDPALANTDPMQGGWFFKLKLNDAAELNGLMNEAEYHAHIEQ